MDYLGWELERQRAALWALLGEAEEGSPPQGEDTGGRRETARARERGLRETGEIAGGGWEAACFPRGFPAAWESVRAAKGAPPGGTGGFPETMGRLRESGGVEAPAREGRSGGTGAPSPSRRYGLAEGGPRIGIGGAKPSRLSGGGRAEAERRETAKGEAAAWEMGPESGPGSAAGERPGGERPGGSGPGGKGPDGRDRAVGAGGEEFSEKRAETRPGNRPGERAGKPAWAAASGLGGGGTAFSAPGVRGGREETRLSRSLPWGEGWESPALRAEDGAKALSRAVQRDARRYDGGFFLY